MKGTVFVVFFISALSVLGQYNAASELWLSVSSDTKIHKKYSLGYGGAYRAKFMDGYGVFGQIGLNYKLNKESRLKLKYRYTYKQTVEGFANKQRVVTDFTTKVDVIKKTDLNYRGRLQVEKENQRDLADYPFGLLLRNKIMVNRKINKDYQLQLGTELFSNLLNTTWNENLRFYVSTIIDVGKKKELELGYIYELTQSTQWDRKISNIISISYSFN